ncbi:MAG: hypothetical protein COA79_24585 [Planctomycetota bacterium]|nr:MAG: hypothetical protein COA79_24585 [Planctomycetota bacterium]
MKRLFVFAMLFVLSTSVQAAEVTELKAFFRDGQTFITWKESEAKTYKVYRSAKKIKSVKDAELVATVAKGSASYPLEVKRKVLEKTTKKKGYGFRYIIEDNPAADPAKMLSQGTGLFVFTAQETGTFYYAVIPDGGTTAGSGSSLDKGIAEKKEPLGAVLVFKAETKDKKGNVTGDRRVYCHWMDHRNWNPRPYGGYAVNFGVGATKGKPKGICMFLHGYSGYYGVRGQTQNMVTITPGDPYQSWFYGHKAADGKTIVNYTEKRILLTIDTVKRILKKEGLEVPETKTYIHGGSMGGTGANFMAAWHPEVFAAVLASKGAVDHNRNGKWTGTSERLLWGKRSENLKTTDGKKVWELLNLCKWHVKNRGKETAFILDAHASNDRSVPFDAVPDYYDALNKARRPFAAIWGPWGHGGFKEPRIQNHKWWGMFSFNSDESVPAISNCSSNDNPRKQKSGQMNCKLEWSARENDFHKQGTKDNIVDKVDRWEVNIRSKSGAEQTADITPRRCKNFKPKPGEEFIWENLNCKSVNRPEKVAEGTVKADADGLVTVEKFKFGTAGWGNRLVIKRK